MEFWGKTGDIGMLVLNLTMPLTTIHYKYSEFYSFRKPVQAPTKNKETFIVGDMRQDCGNM